MRRLFCCSRGGAEARRHGGADEELDSRNRYPHVSQLRDEGWMATSMLHVRMDEDLKAQALAALSAMGLSASDAVRLLFHRIAADQAFPLELKVPNAETLAAMAEAEEMIAAGKARFATAEDMFASLDD